MHAGGESRGDDGRSGRRGLPEDRLDILDRGIDEEGVQCPDILGLVGEKQPGGRLHAGEGGHGLNLVSPKKGSFFGGEGSAGLDHHKKGGRDRPKVVSDGAVPGDGAGEVGQGRVGRKINGDVDQNENRGPHRQGDRRPMEGVGGLAGTVRIFLGPGEIFGFLIGKDHEGVSGCLSGSWGVPRSRNLRITPRLIPASAQYSGRGPLVHLWSGSPKGCVRKRFGNLPKGAGSSSEAGQSPRASFRSRRIRRRGIAPGLPRWHWP